MTSRPRAPWHTTDTQRGRHVFSTASTLNVICEKQKKIEGQHGGEGPHGAAAGSGHDGVVGGSSEPEMLPAAAGPPRLHSCAAATSTITPVARCHGRRGKTLSRRPGRIRRPPTRVELAGHRTLPATGPIERLRWVLSRLPRCGSLRGGGGPGRLP
jgi:hypothetical protein